MIDKCKIESLIYELLKAIGEDPEREGLKDTPMRVAKMYEEIFSGLKESPNEHIKKFKETSYGDDIILIKDIPFYSMCEHHLLPFFGLIHVAYIPKNGEIIGLSKVARIINCYSRRPQVQERITQEIADFFKNQMQTLGAAVVIEAEHMCMTMRGIKAMGSKTKTMVLNGVLCSDRNKKEEFFSLLK